MVNVLRYYDETRQFSVISAPLNNRNAQTGNYTVVDADKGSTIALGGNAFYTLTFNAPSGYDANFIVLVLNEDTGRAKSIALSGGPTFMLYPLQSILVFNQNNVWQTLGRSRWILPTSQTFFVDVTNGNNSNDGLASGVGGAFATIQEAVNTIADLVDLAGFNATIQLADGTYTTGASISGPWVGEPGTVIISGNAGTPANVNVNVSGVFCFQATNGGAVTIQNMRLQGASLLISSALGHARILFSNIDFGATAASGVQIFSSRQSYVEAIGNYSISGGAGNHIQTSHSGNFRAAQASCSTITVSANITYTDKTAYASSVSDITFTGYVASPFSLGANTVTGTRYLSELCSIIQQLVGVNFFPGTVAGSTATGGNYI